MNALKKAWFTLRMARRIGAFKRATERGMSTEEARAYSDNLYPPTRDEAVYEEHLRRKRLPSN